MQTFKKLMSDLFKFTQSLLYHKRRDQYALVISMLTLFES